MVTVSQRIAPWTVWVRRRSAQWGAVFARDVSDGVLTQVATAPINYPGACCVAVTAASVYLALRPKPPAVVNSRSSGEVPVSS